MASLPHLEPGEVALVDLAGDDPRDVVALSRKEDLVVKLCDKAQEHELEKALLDQGTIRSPTRQVSYCVLTFFFFFGSIAVTTETDIQNNHDASEQLAIAERELLEARATYTVKKKAIMTTLMTDPVLKAVHLKAITPIDR